MHRCEIKIWNKCIGAVIVSEYIANLKMRFLIRSREGNLIVDERGRFYISSISCRRSVDVMCVRRPGNVRLDASKNEHGERNVRRNVGHSGAKMQMNRLRHEIGMAPRSLVTHDVSDPR